ncbi:MAG: hypothetical protein AAB316_19575 [Bacteroidota bacterium]
MEMDDYERRLRQKLRELQSPLSKEAELEKLKFDDVVEWEGDKPRLKKKRTAQLEKDIAAIRESVQYVLLAKSDGLYRCKRNQDGFIFLKKGEIWRYGVTRKGQKGRYSEDFLEVNNLVFRIQFNGRLDECLEQEKLKIYEYPLLPENIARLPTERQVYPPGNLRTD